jgi:NAD(P)-dependent dehydrogenase (short-subunit alcohol dehydrogenase family)
MRHIFARPDTKLLLRQPAARESASAVLLLPAPIMNSSAGRIAELALQNRLPTLCPGFDGFTGHIVNRAYNIAAKAGMHGFSKALGRELGPFGITANTVVPGAIDTERDWSQYPGRNVEATRNAIPVRRIGHVDDIAHASVYLCTTGSFVNGQAIRLNGGQYMF